MYIYDLNVISLFLSVCNFHIILIQWNAERIEKVISDYMQHFQVYSLHSICIDLHVFKLFKFKFLLRRLHKRTET